MRAPAARARAPAAAALRAPGTQLARLASACAALRTAAPWQPAPVVAPRVVQPAMGSLYDAAEVEAFCTAILEGLGTPAGNASYVAGTLVDAALRGIDSHGILRMPRYCGEIKDGMTVPDAVPDAVLDTVSMAVVDGKRAFGQVCARDAMALAIAKAKATGVGVVALRNSPHIGRVGTFTKQAADAGLVGVGMCNAGPNAALFGSKENFLGTNPISCAVPVPDGPPVLIDLATTTFTEGKVGYYRNRGDPLPEGIIVDADGKPSTVAAELYGPPPGSLLPMAGHKGSALGVMVELLAGLLTGNGVSADTIRADDIMHGRRKPGEVMPDGSRAKPPGNGTLLLAMSPEFFRADIGGFGDDMARFVDRIRSAAPAEAGTPVLVPGDDQIGLMAERRRTGINIDDATFGELKKLAAEVGCTELEPAAKAPAPASAKL
eukprot:SAG22_NODE_1446_length_4405_cov_1.853460_3_plen_434_part_00